jgi:hypothetical protein
LAQGQRRCALRKRIHYPLLLTNSPAVISTGRAAMCNTPIPEEQYEIYEGFIRDGQIEPDDVPALLQREPEFAKWLENRATTCDR